MLMIPHWQMNTEFWQDSESTPANDIDMKTYLVPAASPLFVTISAGNVTIKYCYDTPGQY